MEGKEKLEVVIMSLVLEQLLINVGSFETESDIIVQKIFRLLGVVRCNAHQVRVVLGDVCTMFDHIIG